MGLDRERRSRHEQLTELVIEQVVSVRTGTAFGSGFLVSGDTLLTCAHVVRGHERVTVTVHGQVVEAEVVRSVPAERDDAFHGFPDLAEVRLSRPLPGIGVWLATRQPLHGSEVSSHGFTEGVLETGIQADTLRMTVAGANGRYVRLQGDQMVEGFSGAPVLDLGTGRVCGVLKASRSPEAVLGGWMIPVEAVRSHFPELVARNERAHRPGTPWRDAATGSPLRRDRLFGRYGSARPRTSRAAATPPSVPASRLLTHGTLPFVERPELGELLDWCDEEPDVLLRLLHAPGGAGKTTLAAELCRSLNDERGWIAGFAAKGAPGQPQWLRELTEALEAGLPVLVVFDYAQARLADICALLDHVYLDGPDGMRLRVLLLARSDEPLWQALRNRLSEDWALAGARVVPLAGTMTGPDGVPLAPWAFGKFAELLRCRALEAPASLNERASKEDSVLGVLALALDAVLTRLQGGTWPEDADPLERICGHETRGWHDLLAARIPAAAALSGDSGRDLAELLLLVPTLAPGRSGAELVAALERVFAAVLPGQRQPDMWAVHTCLRMLYPTGDGRVAPLEPDRIGEILTRRVLWALGDPGRAGACLSALLDEGGPIEEARIAAAAETLEVLARARGCTSVGRIDDHPAHTVLDTALQQASTDRPELLLPALVDTGGVLPYARPLTDVLLPALETCGPELLATIEKRLPGHPSSLSPAAAVVLRRLLRASGTAASEEELLARLHRLGGYSLRLADCGRASSALDAAHEAVALSRDLVRRYGRHVAEHAKALHNMSLLLRGEGRVGAALELSRSAVVHYEQLLARAPEQDPARQRCLLDTSSALSTLALLELADDQVDAAAQHAARAVLLCERARPGAQRDDTLLTCLETLTRGRQRTGLAEEAVVSGAEAVALLEELAERQPGRYLARLPTTLDLHAEGLLRTGRDREAYLALRRAAHHRIPLLAGQPEQLGAQRNTLCILARLSSEQGEFAHERASWLEQLAPLRDPEG
ncbi:trypsin-like peptidase domain-containing protein [Streptomyces gamaensis]|uniref:Trypsin-like peptidase domain-containing protein n=1 Tax=Streptomyces gamaensis TaxID=1763542 RepID=A0ABW0Z9I9_9ACTN